MLKTGILTTLRLDDPQANQTLRCDPNYAQGQEFCAFQSAAGRGTARTTGVPLVEHDHEDMPDDEPVSPTARCLPLAELGRTTWQCVPIAPGLSTGQVGDDIAVATENCANINNNSCQQFDCNYDGNYDGKPAATRPAGCRATTRDADPRVVNLFIVPYQSLKGSTRRRETMPILGFASFYVMNWTGATTTRATLPRRLDHDGSAPPIRPRPPGGAITGVFVKTLDYESGPVDRRRPASRDADPCSASLVR